MGPYMRQFYILILFFIFTIPVKADEFQLPEECPAKTFYTKDLFYSYNVDPYNPGRKSRDQYFIREIYFNPHRDSGWTRSIKKLFKGNDYPELSYKYIWDSDGIRRYNVNFDFQKLSITGIRGFYKLECKKPDEKDYCLEQLDLEIDLFTYVANQTIYRLDDPISRDHAFARGFEVVDKYAVSQEKLDAVNCLIPLLQKFREMVEK